MHFVWIVRIAVFLDDDVKDSLLRINWDLLSLAKQDVLLYGEEIPPSSGKS